MTALLTRKGRPYAVEMAVTNIPVGGSRYVEYTNDQAFPIVVNQFSGGAALTAALANVGAAGMPLGREPDASTTATENNTNMQWMHRVKVAIEDNVGPYQKDPVRMSDVVGDGKGRGWLPGVLVIPAKGTLKVTFHNENGVAVDAWLTLLGIHDGRPVAAGVNNL